MVENWASSYCWFQLSLNTVSISLTSISGSDRFVADKDSIITTYVELNYERGTRLVFKGSWKQQYVEESPYNDAVPIFAASLFLPFFCLTVKLTVYSLFGMVLCNFDHIMSVSLVPGPYPWGEAWPELTVCTCANILILYLPRILTLSSCGRLY